MKTRKGGALGRLQRSWPARALLGRRLLVVVECFWFAIGEDMMTASTSSHKVAWPLLQLLFVAAAVVLRCSMPFERSLNMAADVSWHLC